MLGKGQFLTKKKIDKFSKGFQKINVGTKWGKL